MKNMSSVTIKLDDDLKRRLAEYAEEKDLTMSQVVRRALKWFLDTDENAILEE